MFKGVQEKTLYCMLVVYVSSLQAQKWKVQKFVPLREWFNLVQSFILHTIIAS